MHREGGVAQGNRRAEDGDSRQKMDRGVATTAQCSDIVRRKARRRNARRRKARLGVTPNRACVFYSLFVTAFSLLPSLDRRGCWALPVRAGEPGGRWHRACAAATHSSGAPVV